jgi:hypothetical protein
VLKRLCDSPIVRQARFENDVEIFALIIDALGFNSYGRLSGIERERR